MKIAIGCDHGALNLKKAVIDYLVQKGIEYKDFGCYEAGNDIDYADFAVKAGKEVACKNYDFGVLLCGTGIGMSMAANKLKGIRAAVCTDSFSAKATRAHNNANILCMGERVIGIGVALETLEAFLTTQFESGGRHSRRVDKVMQLEN